MFKFISAFVSTLFLIYLVWPAPPTVEEFPVLPESVRSTLSGDTWQVPNIKAYFSNNYRNFVVPYYANSYRELSRMPLPPLKLNYPPEFAYTAVKDQTESTYLEELVYPLRGSLFVNGLEQFYPDGQAVYPRAAKFEVEGQALNTKVTLRYYPSPLWARIAVWLGINLVVFMLWKFIRKGFN